MCSQSEGRSCAFTSIASSWQTPPSQPRGSRHSRVLARDTGAAEIPREKEPLAGTGGSVRTGGCYSVRAVAVAAEAEVETGFHDVFGLIDAVDESQPIVLSES